MPALCWGPAELAQRLREVMWNVFKEPWCKGHFSEAWSFVITGLEWGMLLCCPAFKNLLSGTMWWNVASKNVVSPGNGLIRLFQFSWLLPFSAHLALSMLGAAYIFAVTLRPQAFDFPVITLRPSLWMRPSCRLFMAEQKRLPALLAWCHFASVLSCDFGGAGGPPSVPHKVCSTLL